MGRLVGRYSENFILARVLGIVLAALWATLIGTVLGISASFFFGNLTTEHLGDAWFSWWVGDAIGILIMAPAMFALRGRYANSLGLRATAERAGALALAIAAVLLLSRFGGGASVVIFLAFPIVVLAGHWFGFRGAAWSVVAIAVPLTAITALGAGPFVEGTRNDSLLDMQAFLAVLAIVSLMLADLKPLKLRLPVATLMIGVAVAAGAFVIERREMSHLDDVRFEQLIRTASDRVQARMAIYTNALRAGAGMYQASERVTRKEWRDFSASLGLMERYPGVYGLGVVVPVAPQRLEEFLVWERFDGAPDLKLKTYPGVDQSARPRRRAFRRALHRAGDEERRRHRRRHVVGAEAPGRRDRRARRRPARHHRADSAVPGFASAGRASSISCRSMKAWSRCRPSQQRRDRFRGWIFAPFVTEEFFRSALGELLARSTRSCSKASPPIPPASCYRPCPTRLEALPNPAGARLSSLVLVDRRFAVRWHAGPRFALESRRNTVLVSCTIVLLAMLLAALIANLQSLRERATSIAEDMTKALAASNERLRAAIGVMEDGFGLFDADDRIVLYNEPFMDEGSRKVFGNKVTGRKFEEIVRAFAYQRHAGHRPELRLRSVDREPHGAASQPAGLADRGAVERRALDADQRTAHLRRRLCRHLDRHHRDQAGGAAADHRDRRDGQRLCLVRRRRSPADPQQGLRGSERRQEFRRRCQGPDVQGNHPRLRERRSDRRRIQDRARRVGRAAP